MSPTKESPRLCEKARANQNNTRQDAVCSPSKEKSRPNHQRGRIAAAAAAAFRHVGRGTSGVCELLDLAERLENFHYPYGWWNGPGDPKIECDLIAEAAECIADLAPGLSYTDAAEEDARKGLAREAAEWLVPHECGIPATIWGLDSGTWTASERYGTTLRCGPFVVMATGRTAAISFAAACLRLHAAIAALASVKEGALVG